MQIRIQEKNLTLIITCPSFTWTRTLAKLTHEGWTVLGHLFSLEQRYMYIFLIVNNTTTPPPLLLGLGLLGREFTEIYSLLITVQEELPYDSRLRFIPNYWHIFIQNNTRIFCLSLHRFLTNIFTD